MGEVDWKQSSEIYEPRSTIYKPIAPLFGAQEITSALRSLVYTFEPNTKSSHDQKITVCQKYI